MRNHIRNYLAESRDLTQQCINDDTLIASIQEAGEILISALSNGNKILAVGNGGSACDASHLVSELMGKYKNIRDPLPAITLNDVATMTCIANDFGFLSVFSRQVNGIGNRKDVLVAFTTSGNSENIIQAVYAAKEKGIKVIAFTGANGLRDKWADVELKVPSTQTGRIQEMHEKIIHLLTEVLENSLFSTRDSV